MSVLHTVRYTQYSSMHFIRIHYKAWFQYTAPLVGNIT